MSDDADARMLAKNFCSHKHTVIVQTLYDVFVMCKEETSFVWKDIKLTATSAMRKGQDKLNEMYGSKSLEKETDIK